MADHKHIHSQVAEILSTAGFEVHPFLVGWYNANVQKPFALPYEADTLAFIVISTPAMFDKAFKPFICRQSCDTRRDLIDECMIHHFNMIKEAFPSEEVEALHDFELTPTRRPKILVQTAGHVAGAAYYYQRSDVVPDHWSEKEKIYGVSVHPQYGGWFALRGVLVFKGALQPHLPRREAPDCVGGREDRVRLLEAFNHQWRDWSYRDIVPPLERYCDLQRQYFETLPAEREGVVQRIRDQCSGVST